jgi:hypothetical protein
MLKVQRLNELSGEVLALVGAKGLALTPAD